MLLRYLNTFNQLGNTAQLSCVGSCDVLRVLRHLLFHELEKAGDYRVTLVVLNLALWHRLGRHEDGTVGYHRDFDLALELRMRVKKPGWQAHAA